MISTFIIRPKNEKKDIAKSEERLKVKDENTNVEYTIAYIGPYTYSWEIHIDNNVIVMTDKSNEIPHNFHIGNANSIGNQLRCILGRNHNIKKVSSGALETQLEYIGMNQSNMTSDFRQKGSIILQNDIWIGENVTIMAGVIVRNGAVIAQNSHVVKDVPAYAIVGGNPAKIIGWRFPEHIIEKLQMIQWWYWDIEKIIENYDYFTEDVEGFCDRFYEEAKKEYEKLVKQRNVIDDSYFMYVDNYENYSSYPSIIEQFMDAFIQDEDKRLILFIQREVSTNRDNESVIRLRELVDEINRTPEIKCRLEVYEGDKEQGISYLLQASHYIITRTFDTVRTSCIADQFGIEIISGVDTKIPFKGDGYNMIKNIGARESKDVQN